MTRHASAHPARAAWLLQWGLVVLMLFGAHRLEGQISPGPLARAHESLEGATNCVKCHGLAREPMSRVCLSCHREVDALMRAGRGYHGREAKASGKQCAQCHPDHAGKDFALIEWPGGSRTRFDHAMAGWSLTGAHTDATCESCHASQYRVSAVAALSPRQQGAGWTGLETTCVSCHRTDDAHRGDLKARCETCHDTRAWAPAPTFDHDKTEYPLTGAHGDVKCDKCHVTPRLAVRTTADGRRVGTFRPVPHRECSSCHVDPHRGALGLRCGDCHVTRGFGVIDKSGFNHQVTNYPLQGRHTAVTCEGCHGAGLARRKPAYSTCAACHADVHAGDATLAGRPTDCASCHTVAGFAPSTFTAARHAATTYPLDGRHLAVACAGCHRAAAGAQTPVSKGRRVPRVARLHLGTVTCEGCHVDVHGGELSGPAGVGAAGCETCHTTSGFAPSTYTRVAHDRLRVTLEGRHGTVACAACHGTQRPGLPTLTVAASRAARITLRPPEVTCDACHADPHGGRYASGQFAGGCPACHDARAWRPATITAARHAGFGYALEGAHRATPCGSCHRELGAAPAAKTLRLSSQGLASLPFTQQRSKTCGTCHADPHGGQFTTRKGGSECESCHAVSGFAPASGFDHDRDASFRLRGAHQRVACATCHKSPSPGAPVVYRPLSAKCESCHGGPAARVNRG